MAGVVSIPLSAPADRPLGGFQVSDPAIERRRQLAAQLMGRATTPRPIYNNLQGIGQIIEGLAAAYTGNRAEDQQREKTTKYNTTLAEALAASKPWKAPEDIYNESDMLPGPRAPGEETAPGAVPAVRAGQPAPGTGGSEAMNAVLAGNPDTAPLAMNLQLAEVQRRQALADALAQKQAEENIYLKGRGAPGYKGQVAGAEREPIDEAGRRAAAVREPIDEAAKRAGATAGATEGVFLRGRGAPEYIASAATAGREPIDEAGRRADATRESIFDAGRRADATREPIDEAGRRAAATREPIDEAGRRAAAVRESIFDAGRRAAAVREPVDEAGLRAAATREPIDEAGRRAAAVREPVDDAGARATAIAAGTAKGQGQARVLTPEEVTAGNYPAGAYLRKPNGEVHLIAPAKDDTVATKNAAALGLKPGTPAYADYIRAATVERPGITIDLSEKVAVEKIKSSNEVNRSRLKRFEEMSGQYLDLEPRLESIVLGLEGGKVNTDIMRDALFEFRQVLNAAGFTVDKSLPQAEQVRAGMAFLAPRMRVIGSGSTSNMEVVEFRKSGPQYSNTTEGNIILGRSFLQIQKRNKAAYDLALRYFQDNGNLIGFDDYADTVLGPVWPKPKSDADYNVLQQGTVYYHPTFKEFRVKREEAK